MKVVGLRSIPVVTRFAKSRFVRNVFKVATGTAAAQAIAAAASPAIARIYGPEALGQLGVFNSIVTVLVPAAALTYPFAIVLPKSEGDARKLVDLSFFVALVVSTIAAVLLWSLRAPIVRWLQLEAIAPYLLLIPPVMLFAAAQQVAQQWIIRQKNFGAMARVSVVQGLAVNGAQVGAGLLHPAGATLIWILSLGRLSHAVLLTVASRGAPSPANARIRPFRAGIGEVARRHRDFPLFRAPEALISAVSQGLPVLLLSSFFGPATAGYFTLCLTVLTLPSRLIGNAVGDVFFPRIAEAARRGEGLTRLIRKATLTLIVTGIWPYLLIIAFGPSLFSALFGDEWRVAGQFARWQAPWLFLGFVARPSVRALPVLSAQGIHLVSSIVGMVGRLGALVVGYLGFHSSTAAVALFAISGALLNLAVVVIVVILCRRFDATVRER